MMSRAKMVDPKLKLDPRARQIFRELAAGIDFDPVKHERDPITGRKGHSSAVVEHHLVAGHSDRGVRWNGRIPSLTRALALQAVTLRDSQIDTMKSG